jgi:4-hydroxy-3-polyprenylbenzoate decarboxylase
MSHLTGPLVVGISGASGVVYGIRLLEVLKGIAGVETVAVVSPPARKNITLETDYTPEEVEWLADRTESFDNLAASISSGSFPTRGMVVVPCSIKTLSDIAYSRDGNLLVRAADVTLKERRPLILVPRETPLHKGHLKLLLEAADNGAVILPPFPAFYHRPKSVNDIVDQTVGKILDQLGIEHGLFTRWGGGG